MWSVDRLAADEVVFNDPSNDVDFRVESNGQTHMLFVDADNDRIGISFESDGLERLLRHIALHRTSLYATRQRKTLMAVVNEIVEASQSQSGG